MDRDAIEQMLTEHQTQLGQVQAAALRIQGAITVLREQLRQIDEAEAESEADDGPGK